MTGGASESYAGAAALGRELLARAPQLARVHAESQLGVLGGVIPELVAGRTDIVPAQFDTPEARHRQVQPALRRWFARVAEERPLLFAINDLHLVDAPSAALLAVLASNAKRRRMLIAVTQPSDQPVIRQNARALTALSKSATTIALGPLSLDHTHSLLSSMFGEVPNLDALVRSIHQITAGMPRDIMALAQHFLEEGVVRYEAGSWSLPQRFSAGNLPTNMADALRQRVEKQSTPARLLAYAISREPWLVFSADEGKLLLPEAYVAELPRVVEGLVAAEVLVRHGEHYQCARSSWEAALAQLGSEAEQRGAGLRLAECFRQRGDGLREAKWLMRAGESERGLTAIHAFAVTSRAQTDADPAAYSAFLQRLPSDWLATFEEALGLYALYPRPPRERFALLNRMASMVWVGLEADHFAHMSVLLKQLEHDSGLDVFADLALDLAPGQRIQKALERAHERYMALPEQLRVFDPGSAIKELVKVLIVVLGHVATTSDFGAYRGLPSLAPIVPLGPGIAFVHLLVEGLGHRLGGRVESAIAVYRLLLQRLAEPDGAGLTPSHRTHTSTRILGSMGVLEAPMGRATSLECADAVERQPAYEHVSALIRYLYHLWRGNAREARRFRKRCELLQLETSANMDLQVVFAELCAHALSSDMTGVRRAVDALRAVSAYPAARAAMHYGLGEYHRLRGDLAAAVDEVQTALSLMEPGEHSVWPNAAGAHVRLLTLLNRHAEAQAVGEAYLASADAQKLGYVQNYIRCPLSSCLSRAGDLARAQALARDAVEVCHAQEITGLVAELTYQTSVLVADASGDVPTLQSSIQHCTTRFQREFAMRARSQVPPLKTPSASWPSTDVTTNHGLEVQLANCLASGGSREERADMGLRFVTRYFNAKAGVLYLRRATDLVQVAQVGNAAQDADLATWALGQMELQELEQRTEATDLSADASSQFGTISDIATHAEGTAQLCFDGYVSVLLAHYDNAGLSVTGVLVLRASPAHFDSRQALRLGAELSRTLAAAE
jgi:hypothetical protein